MDVEQRNVAVSSVTSHSSASLGGAAAAGHGYLRVDWSHSSFSVVSRARELLGCSASKGFLSCRKVRVYAALGILWTLTCQGFLRFSSSGMTASLATLSPMQTTVLVETVLGSLVGLLLGAWAERDGVARDR